MLIVGWEFNMTLTPNNIIAELKKHPSCYYATNRGVLLQGDSVSLLKGINDRCADLILTDPPYGDNAGYGRENKTIANNTDEKINYDIAEDLLRISKDDRSVYIFTNWKFENKIREYYKKLGFNERMLICIVKNNFGMGYGFRNQHEFCIVFEKGKAKYNLNNFSNVIKMEHIQHNKDTHPHQKGETLIERIILHSTMPNDLVLDPFIGSGTTGMLCERHGRYWIGIELEDKYCEMSKNRIQQEIDSGSLFALPNTQEEQKDML
jgi:site-specific DNA-methyltransferase (adenine-specific)